MARKRRLRRSRRSRDRSRLYLVIALLLIGLTVMLLPTGAFSQIETPRTSDVDVAGDSDANLGLVITDPVDNCQRQDLVEVTNTFPQDISVTVALTDPAIGTLYDPQGDSGDSVTFPLVSGNSGIVELDADHQKGGGAESFSFDISASGTVTNLAATRSSTLEGPGSCGGGGGGPPGGGGGGPP